jgi:hypothetical protein
VPVDDLVRRALGREIDRLLTGQSFHIVEFSDEGVIIWNIHRDVNGTPRAARWHVLPVNQGADTIRDDPRFKRLGDRMPIVFVRTSVVLPSEDVLDLFRELDPDPYLYDCDHGLEGILRDSIRLSPLTHSYHLVLLKKTKDGRLYFEPAMLFAAETCGPKSKTIKVRCPRSGTRGIAFAIVTTEGARGFSLLSLQAADLAPGDYDLTADLIRPGVVRLSGLPASAGLHVDHREWEELLQELPDRLPVLVPTHLICLVEVSAASDRIVQRVDWVRELVRLAEMSDAPLKVSLVSYGAHSFERKVPDEAARDLVWAGTSTQALTALEALERHQPVAERYRDAAQLECALALARRKVQPGHGRPVIVTVGAQPPSPPRYDPRLTLLPCPDRVNWERELAELSQMHGDLLLGAIYDRDERDPGIWLDQVGRDAVFTSGVFDATQIAATLGFGGTPVTIPFPLVVPEKG